MEHGEMDMGDARQRRLSDDQRAKIDKMHAEGMSNREIARILNITHKTVGNHLKGIGTHGRFAAGEPVPDGFKDGQIIKPMNQTKATRGVVIARHI